MKWYVLLDGQQTGPLSDDRIRSMVQRGQIQPQDWVWNESLPQWVQAESLPELSATGAVPRDHPDPHHDRYEPPPNRHTGLILIIVILIIFLTISAVYLAYQLFGPPAQAENQTQQNMIETSAPE